MSLACSVFVMDSRFFLQEQQFIDFLFFKLIEKELLDVRHVDNANDDLDWCVTAEHLKIITPKGVIIDPELKGVSLRSLADQIW